MKVKILLEEGETREQAEEALVKALTAQDTGETHTEEFLDPVMAHAAEDLKAKIDKINADMFREIEEELERR